MLRRVLFAIACLLVGASLGCRTDQPPPRVWAAGDMLRLTEATPPSGSTDVWDADGRVVRLFAAGNETVAFQLVVDAGGAGAGGVQVSCGTLSAGKGKDLPDDAVRLFRMRPVAVGPRPPWALRMADGPAVPGRPYDILEPLADARFDLAAGERLAVWVDVSVPRGAGAGEYRGELRVRCGTGGLLGADVRVGVRLTVYDFVLPEARPLLCLGAFSYRTVFERFVRVPGPEGRWVPFVPPWLNTSHPQVRAGLVVMEQLMQLARAHGVDLFDRDLRPVLKRDDEGRLAPRWDDYDAVVRAYLDGSAFPDRLGAAAWPVPVWAGWPDPASYERSGETYRRTVTELAELSAQHLRKLGGARQIFFWPRTGPPGAGAYARHADFAALLRKGAAAEVPILSELPLRPPPESTWTVPEGFAALTDMHAPPAGTVELDRARLLAQPGRWLAGLYLRPGDPPYVGSCGLHAAAADLRALPWVAMRYGCAGIFLPETLAWTESPEADGSGEQRLFHPAGGAGEAPLSERAARGRANVLASVRLKWLRRGLQDAGYLWLLRQRQRHSVADAMVRTMVHYAGRDATGDHYLDVRLHGWVRRGELWRQARRLLGDEVRAAVHPQRVRPEDLLAQRVAWDRLQEDTCRVRAERVRSRLEVLADGRCRAQVRLELHNERPRPVDLTVRLAGLPPGWHADALSARAATLPPGARTTIELKAAGDDARPGPSGRILLPVRLHAAGRRPRHIGIDVPFLRAGRTDRPLQIDGDLGDWPLRPGNRAGEFRLVGRAGLPGDLPGAGLAGRQTAVFALHDGRTLYLAFRCRDPAPQRTIALATNLVQYEQLLACGEDLLEVIADPGRTARAPEDLYHLVVKSNGVLVSERGVASRPPLGAARPWSAGARVAVRRYEGVWTAELAVPLAAFGPGGAEAEWGVNFARFAPARPAAGPVAALEAEASNWAGAARYYYHPQELGTMYLAPPEGATRPAPGAGGAGG